MRGSDITAVLELAADGLGLMSTAVREMHTGIAERAFGACGPAAAPVHVVHDGIARTIYRGVDRGLRSWPKAAIALASSVTGDDADATVDSGRAAEALAAINGLYGDQLAANGNALAIDMHLRGRRGPVDVAPSSLGAEYPDASGRLVVFVHGLCQSDRSWRRPSRSGDRRPYGTRLHDELGYTPLYLRYNTGLHISANGRELAALLDRLAKSWPVPVDEIVLVGHSMGGLVIRSACHYGSQQHFDWADQVRHVVCLGSPHTGADLEKGVHIAAWAAAKLPETRALAGVLNARSDGIKDLAFGACIDDDWRDAQPGEFLRDRCGEVPFLPTVRYHWVAATAAPGVLGAVVGDALVRSSSASGRGRTRQLRFDRDAGLTVAGIHHFDLLNHPDVYARLRSWLTSAAVSKDA